MTKRVLILAPFGLLMAGMQADEQAKVRSLLPIIRYDMPNTKTVGGKVIIDALVPDSFVETDLLDEFPTWEVIGIYARNPKRGQTVIVDGVETVEPDLIEHKALDKAKLQARQNPVETHDKDGKVTSSRAARLDEFPNILGWGNLG